MALHNWYFGGEFILFSSNATIAEALPMPPSAYLVALGELFRLDFSGGYFTHGALQLARWLAGPSEFFVMVPAHALAIAIALRVAMWGRGYVPWLRLTAWAALAGHPVAFFYLSYPRYHFVTWFLTLVVCAVWLRIEGLDLAALLARIDELVHRASGHENACARLEESQRDSLRKDRISASMSAPRCNCCTNSPASIIRSNSADVTSVTESPGSGSNVATRSPVSAKNE